MNTAKWDNYKNKGQRYMQALNDRNSDTCAQDTATIPEATLAEKLNVVWKTIPANDVTLKDGVKESDHFYDVITALKTMKSLYYHSYLSPRPGLIIAASNEGHDVDSETSMPWRWSTVVGTLWQMACTKDDLPASSLKMILRSTITNPDTKDVLKEALLRAKVNMRTLDTIEKTFTRVDEAFYAILGSPNGNGVTWLLQEFAEDFGKKTVTKIVVVAEMDDPTDPLWDIKFFIGNYNA